MNAITKYLQDTRAEMRHVAWPTQMQTIIYTVLVALLSVGVALYLGLFDYIFTSTLARTLDALPSTGIQVTQQPIAPTGSTETTPLAPVENAGTFNIVPSETNQ